MKKTILAITTGIPEKIEMAIAAYETALIRPIAEAPKDGTAILTFDARTVCNWCEDRWDSEFEDWDACPNSSPTHFRPLPPEPTESPDAV